MRVIVLDTETTGLSPKDGHRIVEIGCIEMESNRITGKFFHSYVNPERDVPEASTRITGLTEAFLKPFPVFQQIVEEFLAFIGTDPLVIHNAAFDMRFLNAELEWANKPLIDNSRAIDTLPMARKKFPGSPASLDALCKRFDIDLSKRDKHGALLDAELLCHVYIELLGGRQKTLSNSLSFSSSSPTQQANIYTEEDTVNNEGFFPIRAFETSKEEKINHFNLVDQLTNPLWHKFKK